MGGSVELDSRMKVVGAAFRRWFGGFRVAYLPVLLTYLCFGASMVTSIALLYFEKDTLGLTPGEAARIAFWLGLPWSMKMVVGVASDVRPIFGSRRGAYLIVGALCSLGRGRRRAPRGSAQARL